MAKPGLLVPQNDPQATADALATLLRDDELRAKMSAAAPQQAERLSWANLSKRVVEIYEELGGNVSSSSLH